MLNPEISNTKQNSEIECVREKFKSTFLLCFVKEMCHQYFLEPDLIRQFVTGDDEKKLHSYGNGRVRAGL